MVRGLVSEQGLMFQKIAIFVFDLQVSFLVGMYAGIYLSQNYDVST